MVLLQYHTSMDYKILKNILSKQECNDIISRGEAQYANLNPDQIYPHRYYPGFTLNDSLDIQKRLLNLLTPDFSVTYDLGLGMAINFINAKPGESLGLHIDKPLYEFDDNLQIKPGYENREVSLTILCGLRGHNRLGIDGDDIVIEESDVILMRGYTVHELKLVEADFYMLSAFYCTNQT